MAVKASFVICTIALLAQSAYSACLGGLAGTGLGYGAGLGYGTGLGYGAGCGCGAGVASTGGGLPVSSASPIAPVGVSVLSENCYEGQLCAGGNLPFLGTVGIEGILPTAGAGAVSYGCGDGVAAIATEGPCATGIASPAVFRPGTPSNIATADAKAMSFNGLGFGLGGYPAAGCCGACNGLGYNGLGRAGSGFGAFI